MYRYLLDFWNIWKANKSCAYYIMKSLKPQSTQKTVKTTFNMLTNIHTITYNFNDSSSISCIHLKALRHLIHVHYKLFLFRKRNHKNIIIYQLKLLSSIINDINYISIPFTKTFSPTYNMILTSSIYLKVKKRLFLLIYRVL